VGAGCGVTVGRRDLCLYFDTFIHNNEYTYIPHTLQSRMGSWVQIVVLLLEDVTRAAAGGVARSRRGHDSDSLGGLQGWDAEQDAWGDQVCGGGGGRAK